MNRRDILFSGAGLLALAGCVGTLPTVPIKITLPSELTTLIADANAVISKLSSISSLLPKSALDLLDKAKALVADLSLATSTEGAKPTAANLTSLLDDLLALFPAKTKTGIVGTIITAIQTWLPVLAEVAGLAVKFAARRPTGMSVQQARMVLHS